MVTSGNKISGTLLCYPIRRKPPTLQSSPQILPIKYSSQKTIRESGFTWTQVYLITFLGPAINLSQHQDSQYFCLFGFNVPWVHALVFGNRTKEGRGTCISPLMLFRDDKCYRTCTLYSVKEFHYSWCHSSVNMPKSNSRIVNSSVSVIKGLKQNPIEKSENPLFILMSM